MKNIGSRVADGSLTWPSYYASIDRVRLFLSSISLLALSLSGADEWLYYKQYPWVYDYVSKDWLYLRGSSDGKIYAYRSSTSEWGEFDANQNESAASSGASNSDLNTSQENNDTKEPTVVSPFDPTAPPATFTVQSNNLEMLWVNPGTFTMGGVENEIYRVSTSETPQHNVKITNGFYLGRYETTQGQYSLVTGSNPSYHAQEENWIDWRKRPVENVGYSQIDNFLTTLTANEKNHGSIPEGWSFQLPSEAEWEYACRAGTTTAYPWGQTIDGNKANYREKNFQYTMEVTSHNANQWGFYNMIGNVSEWVNDGRRTFTSSDATDPSFEEYINGEKVWMCRGGNFQDIDFVKGGMWVSTLRSASRIRYAEKHYTIGFRIALKKSN